MLIVEATINMAQSLCTSAFEIGHGRRLHVFAHKLFWQTLCSLKQESPDLQIQVRASHIFKIDFLLLMQGDTSLHAVDTLHQCGNGLDIGIGRFGTHGLE